MTIRQCKVDCSYAKAKIDKNVAIYCKGLSLFNIGSRVYSRLKHDSINRNRILIARYF